MYTNNIFDAIANAESIVVAGHTSPDGDAVGSVLAFAQVLARKGKAPKVLLEEYAERFNFIKGSEYLYKGDTDSLKPDIFFALDCGDKERLGSAAQVFDRAGITYNIDHHISNTGFADFNTVNAGASSASEIVYEIIKDKCELDLDIATAIYSGIVYDTSGFKHSSTSKRTHEVAGELVELGVDTAFIHSKILYEHTASQLRLKGRALVNTCFDEEYGITYSVITKTDMELCGAKNGDTDGIAEYLLNVRGTSVAALITEKTDGVVKISLRSKKYDVNKVAALFGGGGHRLASGATIAVPPEQAREKLIAAIKDEMENEDRK